MDDVLVGTPDPEPKPTFFSANVGGAGVTLPSSIEWQWSPPSELDELKGRVEALEHSFLAPDDDRPGVIAAIHALMDQFGLDISDIEP